MFPETQVCINPGNENIAVIVIRIPQSHETPHAISNNTKVYLRTSEVNNPEELASINDIQWLSNHRQSSITLRERIHKQAEDRFQVFHQKIVDDWAARGRKIQETQTGALSLAVCPTYPKAIFRTPDEFKNIHEKIRVRDYFGTDDVFPPPNRLWQSGSPLIVQDGVAMITTDLERVFYTEVNSYGFYFYRQPLRSDTRTEFGKPKEIIVASDIVARIDEFIDSANKFYSEIGYWGYLVFLILLDFVVSPCSQIRKLRPAGCGASCGDRQIRSACELERNTSG